MVKGRYDSSYINKVFEEIQSRGMNAQDCIVVQMYNEETGTLHILVEEVKTKEMFTHHMKGDNK